MRLASAFGAFGGTLGERQAHRAAPRGGDDAPTRADPARRADSGLGPVQKCGATGLSPGGATQLQSSIAPRGSGAAFVSRVQPTAHAPDRNLALGNRTTRVGPPGCLGRASRAVGPSLGDRPTRCRPLRGGSAQAKPFLDANHHGLMRFVTDHRDVPVSDFGLQASTFAGRTTRKVVPRPSSLSTSIRPRCRSTMP